MSADKRILLSDEEKAIVERLGHGLYTVDFLEEWINRKDNVFCNAPAALQACSAYGFYQAVKAMAQNASCDTDFNDGGGGYADKGL